MQIDLSVTQCIVCCAGDILRFDSPLIPIHYYFAVQNGSLHQKETVHDNDFEQYLTGQSTQVNLF